MFAKLHGAALEWKVKCVSKSPAAGKEERRRFWMQIESKVASEGWRVLKPGSESIIELPSTQVLALLTTLVMTEQVCKSECKDIVVCYIAYILVCIDIMSELVVQDS